ncbi:MAG: hypothetical protein ACHRHE_21740 [Tepidisphaerales bacterium]
MDELSACGDAGKSFEREAGAPSVVLAVFVAVLITGQIASDGKSNWLEGVQLLVV